MPDDPERLALRTRGWTGAWEDFRAEQQMAAGQPLVASALFRAQQAAEKSLKAFLTSRDVPFRKPHDIGEMRRQCSTLNPALDAICARAERLNVSAWIFRYPNTTAAPSIDGGA